MLSSEGKANERRGQEDFHHYFNEKSTVKINLGTQDVEQVQRWLESADETIIKEGLCVFLAINRNGRSTLRHECVHFPETEKSSATRESTKRGKRKTSIACKKWTI